MNARWIPNFLGVLLALLTAAAPAQTFSGALDDSANPALVGSDLGAALFDNAADIANNVALLDFIVPHAGVVSIVSAGFAAGGVDPYFSLFGGQGVTATFLASNYDQAFTTGGDFAYSASLAAGAYTIAIGSFANISFSENLGTGTLADGFTGLGEPGSLGDASYRLSVATPVPEASSWMLLVIGLMAVSIRGRSRRGLPG